VSAHVALPRDEQELRIAHHARAIGHRAMGRMEQGGLCKPGDIVIAKIAT